MRLFWRYLLLVAFCLILIFSQSDCVFAQPDTVPAHIPGRVPILHLTLSPALYPIIGTLPGSTHLELSIGLALRDEKGLKQLLADQINPSSKLYHHYLTTAQFIDRFAPKQHSVDAVSAYLKSQGMKVTALATNRLFISVSTDVMTAEKAFDTKLQQYKYQSRVVYAPSVDPSVPTEIAASIQTIGGLDNVATYHPLGSSFKSPGTTATGSVKGYTPAQLRAAYNVQPLIDAAAGGPVQTIGIFELADYRPSDITTYLNKYQLGPFNAQNVFIDNMENVVNEGSVEVELDMEVVSALAPSAKQLIYIGKNTTVEVNNTYNRIVSDNIAKVVSISWGECEETAGNVELQALNNIFRQGAAQGQSFFAASGDSGAYDCGNGQLSVDSPANDPNVVGVGGTTLHLKPDGSPVNESAWSSNQDQSGGGGGVSSFFPKPSYQAGTSTRRMVPDVSANADPNTGYAVYCTVKTAYCKGWSVIGGTSAAAPLWAAIAANTNQYLAKKGAPSIGNVNAALYVIQKTQYPTIPYNDITTGNNLGYSAMPGYDMATGLGSPNAWNIARDLKAIYLPPGL